MVLMRHAEQQALTAGDLALASHYRHKVQEEAGHDRWAEQDLEGLGVAGIEYGHGESMTAIGQLIAYLRRAVDRDPSLFLSYMLLAEYLTVLVGPLWLQALESRCGISPDRLTVLANHVVLDRQHAAEGFREIDILVTSPEKGGPMLEVLRTSLFYYEQFWNEVLSTPRAA
jgi:hypothetical protein